jgi:phosphatidate cytidylyltransferase
LSEPGPRSPTPLRNWADLGPRLASAFVLIPITAITLWIGGIVFGLVVGLVCAGAYREYETMLVRAPLPPTSWALVGLMALSGPVFVLAGLWGALALLAVMLVVALFAGAQERGWRLFGVAFFTAVIVAILSLRGDTLDGVFAGVYFATVVWMTDSAAFFTGRQIGGEKLAPDISPSKTWSGALGGLLLGSIAGTVVWAILTDSPIWIGAALAVVISLVGQAGDLAESALKRRYRIKDSGDIIPGHGGLMDRLDSMCLAVFAVVLVGLLHGGADNIAAGLLRW